MTTIYSAFKEAKQTYIGLKMAYDILRKKADQWDQGSYELFDLGKITEELLLENLIDHDKEFGVSEAHDVLMDARKKLIEAARLVIKARYPKDYQEVAIAFDSNLYTVQRDLLDIIVSLKV